VFAETLIPQHHSGKHSKLLHSDIIWTGNWWLPRVRHWLPVRNIQWFLNSPLSGDRSSTAHIDMWLLRPPSDGRVLHILVNDRWRSLRVQWLRYMYWGVSSGSSWQLK
jgi:hypothetical protein